MWIKELWDICPNDVADQFSTRKCLLKILKNFNIPSYSILDLGCGDGRSFDFFKDISPGIEWTGLDIEDSMEVKSRHRKDCNFVFFNGEEIPFPDDRFNIIYSNQVFEHVRYPDKLLKEVNRVLSPDGIFLGSVSYLEPFHSNSIFNYTPYGWYTVIKDSGFNLFFLAGGIDGIALSTRSLDREKFQNNWWNLSPYNEKILADSSLSVRSKNYKILMGAGHIIFAAKKF
jgi:SAM-dependent methyltransferase